MAIGDGMYKISYIKMLALFAMVGCSNVTPAAFSTKKYYNMYWDMAPYGYRPAYMKGSALKESEAKKWHTYYVEEILGNATKKITRYVFGDFDVSYEFDHSGFPVTIKSTNSICNLKYTLDMRVSTCFSLDGRWLAESISYFINDIVVKDVSLDDGGNVKTFTLFDYVDQFGYVFNSDGELVERIKLHRDGMPHHFKQRAEKSR